jgi:hypothetical protein
MTARLTTLIALSATAVVLHAPTAGAQFPPDSAPRWEFITSSGRFVPVGSERSHLAAADQSTATITHLVTPNFGLTASVGCGRSRERLTRDRTRTNVFTYGVGAEWRADARFVRKAVFLRPLAGAGVGLRSYDPRGISDDATHGGAALVAVGAEAGVRRLRVRLELRECVADAALTQGSNRTRKDLAVLVGPRLERR